MIKGNRGLTLTELLIVIVITAVLSAMVIPRLLPQTEKAHASEAAGVLGSIRQGEMAYHLDTGSYTAADNAGNAAIWPKLGLDNPNSGTSWSYVADGGSGTGTATRASDGSTILLNISGQWSGTNSFVPSN